MVQRAARLVQLAQKATIGTRSVSKIVLIPAKLPVVTPFAPSAGNQLDAKLALTVQPRGSDLVPVQLLNKGSIAVSCFIYSVVTLLTLWIFADKPDILTWHRAGRLQNPH